jgi:hypothetical protein
MPKWEDSLFFKGQNWEEEKEGKSTVEWTDGT